MATDSLTPIRKNPDVVYSALADGGVLLHLGTGRYHGVNEVGAAIWSAIDDERDLVSVTNELRGRIDDPPADLESDISAFVAHLRARDLLLD
jgi:Coenzyme PQQ synthesis protein D (PqqD)